MGFRWLHGLFHAVKFACMVACIHACLSACVFLVMMTSGFIGIRYPLLRSALDDVLILVLYPCRAPVYSGAGRTAVVLPLLWHPDREG